MPEVEALQPQAFSTAEFCERNKISLSTFFKLQRENRGPRLMKIGHISRISIEAERDWRRAMEAEAASEAARIEHQRRQEHAKRLGQLAAQSKHHISKRRQRGAR
jgi:hypothetical protein